MFILLSIDPHRRPPPLHRVTARTCRLTCAYCDHNCSGKNVLNRFFLLVAKSKSQEAFLAVILLTVIALSTITEGLELSGTLGAFLAGTLLSETKYTPQVSKSLPFLILWVGLSTFFLVHCPSVDVKV